MLCLSWTLQNDTWTSRLTEKPRPIWTCGCRSKHVRRQGGDNGSSGRPPPPHSCNEAPVQMLWPCGETELWNQSIQSYWFSISLVFDPLGLSLHRFLVIEGAKRLFHIWHRVWTQDPNKTRLSTWKPRSSPPVGGSGLPPCPLSTDVHVNTPHTSQGDRSSTLLFSLAVNGPYSYLLFQACPSRKPCFTLVLCMLIGYGIWP